MSKGKLQFKPKTLNTLVVKSSIRETETPPMDNETTVIINLRELSLSSTGQVTLSKKSSF